MSERAIPHPARLLQRFGVLEAPAAAAITTIGILQYAFIAKLWEGYPLRWSGDAIHPAVVGTTIALSLSGTVLIVLLSLRRWRLGSSAARRLERPAVDRSFDAIRQTLTEIARRSTLCEPPDLLYTPKNALALEVRQDVGRPHGVVVVGLEQRKRQRDDPEAFAGQLGHELSHLELAATRIEIKARRVVTLHFRVLAWLLALFALVLGFIDPRGIGSSPRFGGFEPVFASQIYVGLLAQFEVLLLSSAIIFVYSYFFLVRSEHIHDVRGSQMVGSDVLAERVFGPLAEKASLWAAVRDFFTLHPPAAERRAVVRGHDVILLSAVLFPLIVAGVQPLVLLLSAGWRGVFGVEEHWWNLGLAVAAGLTLYLALSADLARLGLGALLGTRTWIRIPVYAACAGLATQLPRILLEVTFGVRRGFPAELIVERIASGFWGGGGRIALMVAILLLALTYLSAVRIAASGEAGAGRSVWLDRCVIAAIVIGAFMVASLKSVGFVIDVLVFVAILSSFHLSWFIGFSRCDACNRLPLESLALRTRCRCGAEHLTRLRKLVSEPYKSPPFPHLT